MSIRQGNLIISGITDKKIYNAHNLLDFKWSDHKINDMSWLRADTFSWQSGDVYSEVYNELEQQSNEWWETHITKEIENGIYFIRTSKGYKICDPDQEQNIMNAYNSIGVAWFYILDKSNRKFKLPRTKYGFTGLRDGVGNYVSESLPNITGSFNRDIWGFGNSGIRNTTGAIYGSNSQTMVRTITNVGQYNVLDNGTGTDNTIVNIDASRCSSAYQDNAPVQERATQMYLYFYVGQFEQTAIEQTAGITSEQLNTKIDKEQFKLKADDSAVVHRTGDEEISGRKTFEGNGWITRIKNIEAKESVNPQQWVGTTLALVGSDDSNLGVLENAKWGDERDSTGTYVGVYKDEQWASLGVGINDLGETWCHATEGVRRSIVDWGMLNYAGIITFSANTPAPSCGFIIYNLDAGTGSIAIDGVSLPVGGNDASNEGPISLPIRKGSSITSLPGGHNLRFIPCIGG